jgi:FdhD protein
MSKASVSSLGVLKFRSCNSEITNDLVAVEEPLEILLDYGPLEKRRSINLAITMRTPGDDLDLVQGFLATEQLVKTPDELVSVRHCKSQHNEELNNTVKVQLHPKVRFDPGKTLRNFYINSSCGVCGKASIDSVLESCEIPDDHGPVISAELVRSLPEKLRERQLVFNRTGGLHAAGIFDDAGTSLWLREDVGRHNAVDKVLGAAFAQNKWPLDKHVLLVSGRISFELVQKALSAGVRFMMAVGAPSSLAVALAKQSNMTLLGFVSNQRFNVYHGRERIKQLVQT